MQQPYSEVPIIEVVLASTEFNKLSADERAQLEQELKIKIKVESYPPEGFFIECRTPIKSTRTHNQPDRRRARIEYLKKQCGYDEVEEEFSSPDQTFAPLIGKVKHRVKLPNITANLVREIVKKERSKLKEAESSEDNVCRRLSFGEDVEGQEEREEPAVQIPPRRSWAVPVLSGITLAGAVATGICFYKVALIVQPAVQWLWLLGLSPGFLALLGASGVAGIVLLTLGTAFLIQRAVMHNTATQPVLNS